jgi:hypothetical protein
MTENKFRERRSAFREESENGETTPEASGEGSGERSIGDADIMVEEGSDAALAPEVDVAAELDRMAEMEPRPASFLEIVEPHVERALAFLGELPLGPEGERRVLPRWAKHEIDLLGLLEERTRGNLAPDEERFLQATLDQLRTLYLKAAG